MDRIWTELKVFLRSENIGNYNININVNPRFRLTSLAVRIYKRHWILLNKEKVKSESVSHSVVSSSL